MSILELIIGYTGSLSVTYGNMGYIHLGSKLFQIRFSLKFDLDGFRLSRHELFRRPTGDISKQARSVSLLQESYFEDGNYAYLVFKFLI